MIKTSLIFGLLLVVVLQTADAKNKHRKNRDGNNSEQSQVAAENDAQIAQACEERRRANFVQGSSMEVVRVLQDDTRGSQHQKWVVRLSTGKLMISVYNMDITERVPIKVGDVVDMGGEFIWTNEGCMLHWLHEDPRNRRPDGYVRLNGQTYGRVR